MKISKCPDNQQLETLLQRPAQTSDANLEAAVAAILNQVKKGGDHALKNFTRQFDGVELTDFEVTSVEIQAACEAIPASLKTAIRTAAANIETFHAAQREHFQPVETMPGVRCWRKSVPIERVGLYVPGGTAPLFSTVLMLGVPARLAGCREIVLCTPPGKDGKNHPAILFAAQLVGIQRIFKVGGAQAVAAMAFGTETIPQVDKIFGPGNRYVTCAKMLLQKEGVAIDLPAGPSEVLVFADETCVPEFAAADLLSQAEHDVDSQVVFLTTSEKVLAEVVQSVENQVEKLPRQKMLRAALAHSVAILLPSEAEIIAAINRYAPEHLILACQNAEVLAEQVGNAGSVFLGNFTPESAGDYASGTNHTLPTNGFARSYSGVSLDSFLKKITFQQITPEGLANLAPTIVEMAEAEQLQAHAEAVRLRCAHLSESLKLSERSLQTAGVQLSESFKLSESWLDTLVRPNIRSLRPYSSARSLFQPDNQENTPILLDANENAHQLFGEANLNRYPDPLQRVLKEKIAELKGVSSAQIFLGNGSDEAIDLLLRIFCEPGQDEILVCPPTYGMYEVAAAVQNVAVKKVWLDENFQLQPEKILEAAAQTSAGFETLPTLRRSKLLFLCSPNNPTGNLLDPAAVEFLLRNFPGIVVVDEAYLDFSEAKSWSHRLPEFPNLVVLQTFSKAWALAGLRLGMAFASPQIVHYINKVKYPYNLNQLTQQTVLNLLEKDLANGKVNQAIEELVSERNRLAAFFERLPNVVKVFPSDANFLLVKFKQSAPVFDFLKSQGIIIRDRSSEPLCENCLRITVGTAAENEIVRIRMSGMFKDFKDWDRSPRPNP